VSEFIEHDHVGLLAKRRVVIEVLEDAVADRYATRRYARQALRQALQIGTPLRFDPADDDAFSIGRQTARVFQEPARLARAGCAGDIYYKPSTTSELT
jgi:hypothetical protein